MRLTKKHVFKILKTINTTCGETALSTFINQEIYVYFFVKAARLTRTNYEGFSEVLYIQCNGWQ
jgi:hypothetical protein